jgi:hypothetical protein
MSESIFNKLSAIKTKEFVESKGSKAEYISWSNAWRLLKETYPDATRVVYESSTTGLNYHSDGRTAYVKVGVIINGMEHIDYLPVMDFRNASIPLDKLTSMDVNKTIQRSTTKAIAMHGLGLNLWTGEEEIEEPKAQPKVLKEKLTKTHEGWDKMMQYIDENKDLGAEAIIKQIERKYVLTSALKTIITKKIES